MKKYTDFSHSDIISYGLNTMFAMSIYYFGYMQDEINLLQKIEQSDKLIQIMREFSETALWSIGEPTFDPIKMPRTREFDGEKLDEAWIRLFTNLNEMGYVSTVQDWFNYLIYLEVDPTSNNLNNSFWMDVILNWDKVGVIPNGPNLPQLKMHKLMIIMLEKALKSSKLCCKLLTLINYENNDWAKYIIKSSATISWMKDIMKKHRGLNMWRDIFSLLNEEEIKILDEWGIMVADILDMDGYVSLSQSAQDIQSS